MSDFNRLWALAFKSENFPNFTQLHRLLRLLIRATHTFPTTRASPTPTFKSIAVVLVAVELVLGRCCDWISVFSRCGLVFRSPGALSYPHPILSPFLRLYAAPSPIFASIRPIAVALHPSASLLKFSIPIPTLSALLPPLIAPNPSLPATLHLFRLYPPSLITPGVHHIVHTALTVACAVPTASSVVTIVPIVVAALLRPFLRFHVRPPP